MSRYTYLKDFPTNYIMELQDYPFKGMSVRLEIVHFTPKLDKHFFEIVSVRSIHSFDLINRSTRYTSIWNSLPRDKKDEVFDLIDPIPKATVSTTANGYRRRVLDYFDVFVVNYFPFIYRKDLPNLEEITFRSRKTSDFSARVVTVSTP